MSIEASMDIRLNGYKEYSIMDIINNLIEEGWGIKDEKSRVWYLPIGDDDDFDWEHNEISAEELSLIVKRKEKLKETVGVILYWEQTNIGVSVLCDSWMKFSINLSINRKKIDEDDIRSVTDVNWYVRNIINPLKKEYQIEKFSFEEYQ